MMFEGGVSRVLVTVLVDSATHYEGPILAENGISFFIEAELNEGKIIRILMDSGITGDALLRNADELGVDLRTVDIIFLSHNHYDHTGGLLKVLKAISKRVPVVMHPETFSQKYAILPSLGLYKLVYTGPPYTLEQMKDAGGVPLEARVPVPLAQGITTTGEIPRVTDFEVVKGFYIADGGVLREDKLLDDQALVIKMDGGDILIFTGCGHSGVINTIMHAKKIANSNRVRAVIGGFHLIDADENRIMRTVDGLKEAKPDIIAPMHCTGFKAMMKIAQEMPDAFREFYCGDSIEFR